MDSKKSLFIRVNGHTLKAETTEEEEEFRQTQFPNENSVLKKNINCTSCGKSIKEKIISKDIHIHPVLEVLWCKKCEEFYSDGDFSADEDGSDKYCRWCAQGGDLYCCSHCSVAFCVSCVKRNLPRKTLKDIEDDDWKCFVCVTNPLWPLRAICDAAKRYVDANTKSRKSSRLTKNQSEGDTTESEVSSRSRRRTKADSTEDEKYNADSEDTASTEANKNKRKYTTSSEDDTRKRSRRLKTSDEKTEPPPHPDEKKKDKFESIITDLINESAILRKLHTKTETSWKKNFLNIDVNNLNEYANKAEEDIAKFFKDFHTSIALIEKSFTDKFTILKKELSEKPQSPAPSDMEITVCDEPPAPVDDPVGANDTANISDQNVKTPEKPETKIVEKSTSSPEKSNAEKSPANETPKAVEKSPLKSTDEPNENADITVNGTDADVTIDEDVDKATPNDVSKKSAGDSLTVNFSSVIETLDSEEESILRKNDISDQPEPTEQPSNTDLQNDTVVFNENQNSKDESLNEVALKENEAKKLLLLSSSDSATECETKKLSSDSELSGVSVLHSDQDDANKTKQKRKKTRKELNNLAASRSDSDNDVTDEEKEIEKLSNLTNLKKRKSRLSSNSENSEKENKNSEKESSKKAKKAKKSKTSIVQYFGQESGNDTDTSNISISKFNAMLENKNKAFLNGEEELSKKVLLEFSSHDEKSDEEIPEEKLVEENAKQSTKQRKSSKKESLNGSEQKESDDEKLPEKTLENSLNDECEKEDVVDEKPEKSKWRSNRLLRGKLSETDTSDEERMREREKARKLQEEEKTIELSDHSSDSEDIFRSSKPCTTKKRRKKIAASSGSEFEVEKEKQSSDDSVQIISEEEKDTKKKKRRRIKKFDVSGSSDDDSDGKKKTPGSASKGRKNIRKMLKEEDLDEVTRKTAKEEEERKKRIAERQNLFNESFKIDESLDKAPSKLVLDFDPETKEEIIVVHPSLIKKLKPHQVKGVKFMWDSCYESVKMATTTPGGGCILAHCMGLGKTLQVIALVHTVMRYPVLNVNRVLILCPLSTVLNWVAEFEIWLQDVDYGDDIDVFNLNKTNQAVVRADLLNNWYKNGGVMILGYEMFRNLVNTNKVRKKIKQYYLDSLLDPGPDLVVCDEGHMLKNEQSALSQATMKIKCRRRIVLTGTPLQNNLVEYHCMVQFVKPNLLGEKKEFLNRFANPITNGQYSDSTSHDVRVMKRRAHVLHKMLDGVVQRFDYNVLTPFLPNKHEFVILVALSDVQAKLYEHYINTYSKKVFPMSTLFKDYQIMRLIWTHPYAMKLHQEKKRRIMEKRINSNDEDSEGSLRDFVVNSSESEDSSSNSGDSVVSIRSDDSNRNKKGRLTRAKKKELGINDDELQAIENDAPKSFDDEDVWWKSMVTDDEMNDYKMGPKLILLFAILKQCELIGDKLLVFSQSIPSLDMIEYFLEKLEDEESKTEKSESYYGTWQKGLDYFRLDGQTTPDLRKTYCNSFNKTSNTRSRLFLISTKAGGLGINLTAANRVIIFDASWNPSYDVQSIFRIYRFGQSKPCYVYRFLAQGTMEEKIYERQVTKLSISCRVVDEQQIDRHFNNADVVALYDFNRKKPCEDETPKLPKDRLMAELLKEYKNEIIGYHEHDSLLENIVEEELNEEERKQAWEDYENEKKGVHLQQNVPVFGGGLNFDRATIMEALKKEHPNVSESQLNVMHSMVVEKLKRHYIERLKLQQIQQMQDALNIRPNFNTQNIQRPPAPMMQYPQGQSTLSHFMANPAQQAKLKLDFAKKNTINNFLGGSSSQK